ncbi:hypothetical protein D9756_001168 [Leucocoprinus leucothites]|uniref:Uncharacterized protein n=1 Tax=Leucocoprinus leucothites TaxID=201217 RepID=A0A8H5G4E6_9AGAR|nr:hypothetical protein D9756_001168 [Leucoagaricus leucothites]
MARSVHQRSAEDILPEELWGECWRYADVKDIWNVRLACQGFARTGRPWMYRVLHSWSPNQEDVEEKNWDIWCKHFLWSAQRFVVVATGPFIYYVEEWSFSGIDEPRNLHDTNANIRGVNVLVEAYKSALTIFLNTLPLYPNLHTITLTSMTVDQSVFDALARIPKLQSLALVETSTVLRPSSMAPWPLSKLRIVIGDKPDSPPLDDLFIASPTLLDTLTLHSYRFSEACLRPLAMAEETLGTLTHLSLNLKQDTLFLLRDILQLSPSLESLGIQDFDYQDSRDVQYPPLSSFSRIPRLRSYHGPAYLAARVLAASPFTTLSLHSGKSREYSYSYSELYKLLRPLSHSAPSYLSFSVVIPDPRFFDLLGGVFSTAHSLSICFGDPTLEGESSSEYRQVVLANGADFAWPVRPANTLVGLLDRLVVRDLALPYGLKKLKFIQADPYGPRRILPQDQRLFLDKLAYWYRDLVFFQIGENPPLMRVGPGSPWFTPS